MAVSVVWPWLVQSLMIGLPCCCPTGVTHSRTPLPAELIWKVYVSLKLAVSVPVHWADQLLGPTALEGRVGRAAGLRVAVRAERSRPDRPNE